MDRGVIFSEKKILSRRLNFFLESVKVSKEQIIVQRVTNAERNKILFLAILFCFTPYTFCDWLNLASTWGERDYFCGVLTKTGVIHDKDGK